MEKEFCDNCNNDICCCIIRKQEQDKKMYSEEEVYNLLCSMPNFYNMTILQQVKARDKWFEQFKKK